MYLLPVPAPPYPVLASCNLDMSSGETASDDDISITSTVPSEPKDEYEVEVILAQRTFAVGEMYLLKWVGYPYERCTWEP